jgi:hypothetical protein
MEETPCRLVAQEGIILEAVPQLFDHIDMFRGAGIADGMGMLLIEVEVMCRRLGRRRHHVPASAAVADQIQRGEFAGEVVGFLIGGRGRGD